MSQDNETKKINVFVYAYACVCHVHMRFRVHMSMCALTSNYFQWDFQIPDVIQCY